MEGWALLLAVVASVALAVAIGLLILAAFPARSAPADSLFSAEEDAAVFLFDGEALVDASPAARTLLSRSQTHGAPLVQLCATLAFAFPDLEANLARLPASGTIRLRSAPARGVTGRVSALAFVDVGEDLELTAELRGGLMRIVLCDPTASGAIPGAGKPDPLIYRAMAEEVADLRRLAGEAPLPIWREREDGEVVWANAEYLCRAAGILGPEEELGWPLPRLFEQPLPGRGAAGQRQRLTGEAGRLHWFELSAVADGAGRMVYALPADAAVRAEHSLRDFVQILTQTFAHLPIGLAIFDRGRQLHMFNPALLDLTGLPADFLSLRPSLRAVLDALHDSNMLPEPRDYRGWRRQLVEMERAAAAGLYEEVWHLSGGQTYRVMARPHPNGGLALMIEDVSVETLRSRRDRAALDLHQAVVDAMEEAVAVFARDGELVLANPAYAALWGRDPAAGLSGVGFHDCCRDWQAATAPSAIWERAADFVAAKGSRDGWQDRVRLSDGRLLACRFQPLPGGATLAGFRIAGPGGDLTERGVRRGGLKGGDLDEAAAKRLTEPPRNRRRA